MSGNRDDVDDKAKGFVTDDESGFVFRNGADQFEKLEAKKNESSYDFSLGGASIGSMRLQTLVEKEATYAEDITEKEDITGKAGDTYGVMRFYQHGQPQPVAVLVYRLTKDSVGGFDDQLETVGDARSPVNKKFSWAFLYVEGTFNFNADRVPLDALRRTYTRQKEQGLGRQVHFTEGHVWPNKEESWFFDTKVISTKERKLVLKRFVEVTVKRFVEVTVNRHIPLFVAFGVELARRRFIAAIKEEIPFLTRIVNRVFALRDTTCAI